MKIINPLYDNAFKYLMDNEQIARKVLGIILNLEILSLQAKPQETIVYTDRHHDTSRYDFKAIIRNAKQEETCVLIELQKYNNPNPIMRFREYLGQNYGKEETFINSEGNEVTQALPIIAIYILGYKVTQAEILAFKVERNIVDIIWDTPVEELPEFVKLLTHTSIILQVNAKPKELKNNQLEKFLRLFTQKLKNEEPNYVIELPDIQQNDENDILEIISYLERATINEKIVRSLKYEAAYEKSIRDVEEALKETKLLAEQAEVKAEQAEAKAEQERKEKQLIIKNSIQAMHNAGISNEVIANALQLSILTVADFLES